MEVMTYVSILGEWCAGGRVMCVDGGVSMLYVR